MLRVEGELPRVQSSSVDHQLWECPCLRSLTGLRPRRLQSLDKRQVISRGCLGIYLRFTS